MFIQIKARSNHSYTKIYNLFVNTVQVARNDIYYLLLNLNSSKSIPNSQPGMMCCSSKDIQYNVLLKYVVPFNEAKIGGELVRL